jgi:hypothetical protein
VADISEISVSSALRSKIWLLHGFSMRLKTSVCEWILDLSQFRTG